MTLMGHATAAAFGPVTPMTKQFEFESFGIVEKRELVSTDGIRGTRSQVGTQVGEGTISVGGTVQLAPRPDELAILLTYIMGANSGNDYTLTETLPAFIAQAKYGSVMTGTYSGLKVNQATFSSAKNQPLKLALDCQGKAHVTNIAFADIESTLSIKRPYMHHQGALTIGAVGSESALAYDNPQLVINNALQTDRFQNSQTRTDLPEQDRQITFAADFPFTSAEKTLFYQRAIEGLQATWTITRGDDSIAFVMPLLQYASESPIINARGQEVGWRISLNAKHNGTDKELVITNVNA